MPGVIGDLLDTGRIELGTLTVAPEPSEVAALVEQARSTFLSGGGRHAVVVDLPAGLPPVMADRRRIMQVLNNLFANAARHAPASSPIRVAAVREDAHVAVSVSDEGPGVAPECLAESLSKYARAGEGATAGHGLGLAICKGLVEAHGGRIRAESTWPQLRHDPHADGSGGRRVRSRGGGRRWAAAGRGPGHAKAKTSPGSTRCCRLARV